MVETDGEQQALFGAGPGPVVEACMTVIPPREGQMGEVRFTAWSGMRKDPMHLRVTSIRADQMAVAVGYAVPLAIKAHYVGPQTLKKHIWQVYRRLGIAGWEVEIRGCGRG
jgi:hypothetical protein